MCFYDEQNTVQDATSKVFIDRGQSNRKLVNSLLSELLHAIHPTINKDTTTETAMVLEQALYRLGYALK